MKGLELAEAYYREYGHMILLGADRLSPGLSDRLSIGLAGEGSQCWGFDDAISRDHDFAPGFCIWMSEEDFGLYGPALQEIYLSLPSSYHDYDGSNIIAEDRLGVMSTSNFFHRFTGFPKDDMDWIFLSESALSAATNGVLWLNKCEDFSEARKQLLAFYPEDVLRKKLASRAAVMSQAGQYNLARMIKRKDSVASLLALSKFTEAAISAVHLLNRSYTPFYKWAFYSLSHMEYQPAKDVCLHLNKMPHLQILLGHECWDDAEKLAFEITENICLIVAKELNRQGYSKVKSAFLQDHLTELMSGIRNPEIRAMHPMADPAV